LAKARKRLDLHTEDVLEVPEGRKRSSSEGGPLLVEIILVFIPGIMVIFNGI
jgi:hypothetical protein